MNAPLAERRSRAANRSATRVMVLVADSVSLITVSPTLEPFKQTNTLLRRDKFSLQRVSLSNSDSVTPAGPR